MIHRADDAVPRLRKFARGFIHAAIGQIALQIHTALVGAHAFQIFKRRGKLPAQILCPRKPRLQLQYRFGDPAVNFLHRLDFGVIAARKRPRPARAVNSPPHGVIAQAIHLIGGRIHIARAQKRKYVLRAPAAIADAQRGDQAFRGRRARNRAAAAQKQRHIVQAKRLDQRLPVAFQIGNDQLHIAPAHAAHRQPPRRRRRLHTFLPHILRHQRAHMPRRAAKGALAHGVNFIRQRAHIRLPRIRRVYAHARAAALRKYPAKRLFRTLIAQIIPRFGVILQRKEKLRVRARSDAPHQLNQRVRHHIKSIKEKARPFDKRGALRARGGGDQFGIAVLISILHPRVHRIHHGGEIKQSEPVRARFLFGAGAQIIARHQALRQRFQLLCASFGKAAPAARVFIDRQLILYIAQRGAHQHHPPAIIHAHPAGNARRLKDQPAQARGRHHAQTEGTAQMHFANQRALRQERQLARHDDE